MEPGVVQVFGRHVKLPVLSAGKRNFAMVIFRTIAGGLEEFVTTAADNESFRVIFNAGQGLIPRFTGLSGKFPNDGGGGMKAHGIKNQKNIVENYFSATSKNFPFFFLGGKCSLAQHSGERWERLRVGAFNGCFPLIIPVLYGFFLPGRSLRISLPMPCPPLWKKHPRTSGMAFSSRYFCFI